MFCPNCGNQLPDDARFCGGCGTRITAAPVGGAGDKSASAAPVQGPSPARAVGAAPSEAPKAPKAEKTKKAAKGAEGAAKAAAKETLVSAGQDILQFTASPEGGEMALGTLAPSLPQSSAPIPGPLKVIGGGLKNLFTSLAAAVKDPKRLIPALVLAIVWLVLDILKAAGVESQATRALSFLSFANGGMEGGAAGLIGGILGKGLFAGAVTAAVGQPGKKPEGEKRSPGSTLRGGFGVGKDTLWAWLAGVGAALLLYCFFSGGALKMSFMAGVACAYLAARAAPEEGFLKKLLSSFTAGGKAKAGPGPAGVARGLAVGFAAASLLALAEKRLLLLIPGGVLLLGGGVMGLLQARGVLSKKDAAGAE